MNIPAELKYTKDHEWTRIEGDIATIGITDYAQSELGDVVFIELPEEGTQLDQSEVFGTIEAVKTVSDLFAPLTGEVVAVNRNLEENPESVNNDPYGEGWMIKIKVADAAEVENLLDSSQYDALL